MIGWAYMYASDIKFWHAIFLHFQKALKKAQGGRICSFSPCLEQVQKACAKLDEEGFIEISTMECLLREFQVRKITIPLYDHNKESSEYVPNTPAATIEDSNNKRKLEETSETNGDTKKPNLETSFVTGIPLTTMPGHTGYLTFATLKPDLSQSINWFCDLLFKIVYFAEVKDEIEKKICAAESNRPFSTFSVKMWICCPLILWL